MFGMGLANIDDKSGFDEALLVAGKARGCVLSSGSNGVSEEVDVAEDGCAWSPSDICVSRRDASSVLWSPSWPLDSTAAGDMLAPSCETAPTVSSRIFVEEEASV
jgi:hypothetical protein